MCRCWQCGGALLGQLVWRWEACARPLGGREVVREVQGRGRTPGLAPSFEREGAESGELAAPTALL